jgi:hypothetical protein
MKVLLTCSIVCCPCASCSLGIIGFCSKLLGNGNSLPMAAYDLTTFVQSTGAEFHAYTTANIVPKTNS